MFCFWLRLFLSKDIAQGDRESSPLVVMVVMEALESVLVSCNETTSVDAYTAVLNLVRKNFASAVTLDLIIIIIFYWLYVLYISAVENIVV